MTKQDIVRQLEERTNLSIKQASQAVEGIIGIIADALSDDEAIFLRGFGTIKTVKRAPKHVRNICKGTSMIMPPRKQVKLVACKSLKERINTANHGHPDIMP